VDTLTNVPLTSKDAKDVDSLYTALKNHDYEKIESVARSTTPEDFQRVVAHVTGAQRLKGEKVTASYRVSQDASVGELSYLDTEDKERHLTLRGGS
jgi:hypothetical protein